MADRYAQLRAALDAGPTPGLWSACGSAGYVQAGEGHPRHTILAVAYGHDGNHQFNAPGSRENGMYIAAANPETIRALLAERDALREALLALINDDDNPKDTQTSERIWRAARAALAQGKS